MRLITVIFGSKLIESQGTNREDSSTKTKFHYLYGVLCSLLRKNLLALVNIHLVKRIIIAMIRTRPQGGSAFCLSDLQI